MWKLPNVDDPHGPPKFSKGVWIGYTLQVILFDLIGVPIAMVRFFEPYVYNTFKMELKMFFEKFYCFKKKDKSKTHKSIKTTQFTLTTKTRSDSKTTLNDTKKIKFANESLCSFLNSAANIEFVYVILLGIN